jgi:hypothetical protein
MGGDDIGCAGKSRHLGNFLSILHSTASSPTVSGNKKSRQHQPALTKIKYLPWRIDST